MDIGGGLSGRELCHGSEGTWVRVPLDTRLYLSQPEQANVLIEYTQSSLIECGSRESLSGINQRRNLQKIVELDEN